MKFIYFLNEWFSDREDYNDFLSFYKKIIKSYNNEEAVLSKLQEMNEKAYTIGYIGKTSGGDSKICLK